MYMQKIYKESIKRVNTILVFMGFYKMKDYSLYLSRNAEVTIIVRIANVLCKMILDSDINQFLFTFFLVKRSFNVIINAVSILS